MKSWRLVKRIQDTSTNEMDGMYFFRENNFKVQIRFDDFFPLWIASWNDDTNTNVFVRKVDLICIFLTSQYIFQQTKYNIFGLKSAQ